MHAPPCWKAWHQKSLLELETSLCSILLFISLVLLVLFDSLPSSTFGYLYRSIQLFEDRFGAWSYSEAVLETEELWQEVEHPSDLVRSLVA